MDEFFAPFRDSVEFKDLLDFNRKVAQLDAKVPGRTEGRVSAHRERYCIVAWLREMVRSALIQFPFRVQKKERPDFMITTPEGSIGLEHTDAGTRKYQSWLTVHENAPGAHAFNKDGHVRGEYERDWRRDIEKALHDKHNDIKYYYKTDIYQLMIYDNSEVTNMSDSSTRMVMGKVLENYRRSMSAEASRCFSAVSLVRDAGVAHFIV